MSELTDELKNFLFGFFHSMHYEMIEAGCADGQDTAQLAALPGVERVYAFEPDERMLTEARTRCANLKNVSLYNMALSDKNGEAEFFVADRFGVPWGASSLLEPKHVLTNHHEITFKASTKVKTINLDTWLEQYGEVSNVQAIWFDLQGSEPDVLRAAPKMLSQIQLLYAEVHTVESYKSDMLWPDFKAWLGQQGFTVVCEELPWKDGGNALLVRTQHREWAKQVANVTLNEAKKYIVL